MLRTCLFWFGGLFTKCEHLPANSTFSPGVPHFVPGVPHFAPGVPHFLRRKAEPKSGTNFGPADVKLLCVSLLSRRFSHRFRRFHIFRWRSTFPGVFGWRSTFFLGVDISPGAPN